MLNKLCVLTVKVNNIQGAINFYTEVLDFEVSKYYGEKIVSLVHNGVPIVIEETETKSNNNDSKLGVLLGILSENIEGDYRKLKERGAKLLFEEPKPCPPGRYFVIEDPSGNQIEIVEFSN